MVIRFISIISFHNYMVNEKCTEAVIQPIVAGIPLGRVGEPEEVKKILNRILS